MTQKAYAITGLLAPILFWITYFTLSATRPEYHFTTKAVSELGSIDAPHKWVWNGLGYILPGVLIAVYAVGLYKSITQGQGNKWPVIGIALSGLFMSLSGIFPGDFDNRQSATMLWHTAGSIGSFIFFLVGAFTFPGQMKELVYWKKAVRPTLLFTWLAVVFGVWGFVFPHMPAVGQRLIFFFYFLWIFYTAMRMYRERKG